MGSNKNSPKKARKIVERNKEALKGLEKELKNNKEVFEKNNEMLDSLEEVKNLETKKYKMKRKGMKMVNPMYQYQTTIEWKKFEEELLELEFKIKMEDYTGKEDLIKNQNKDIKKREPHIKEDMETLNKYFEDIPAYIG